MIWLSLELIVDIAAIQAGGAIIAGAVAAPLLWYAARKWARDGTRSHA